MTQAPVCLAHGSAAQAASCLKALCYIRSFKPCCLYKMNVCFCRGEIRCKCSTFIHLNKYRSTGKCSNNCPCCTDWEGEAKGGNEFAWEHTSNCQNKIKLRESPSPAVYVQQCGMAMNKPPRWGKWTPVTLSVIPLLSCIGAAPAENS